MWEGNRWGPFVITCRDLLGNWNLIYTTLDTASSEVWAFKVGMLPPMGEVLAGLVPIGLLLSKGQQTRVSSVVGKTDCQTMRGGRSGRLSTRRLKTRFGVHMGISGLLFFIWMLNGQVRAVAQKAC